jgi:phosphoribosylformimino-5-aminoimidazole carboxamide ribotide isomerase
LKDHLVVRGVGGRREEYRPIGPSSAAPAAVAGMWRTSFGFDRVYVADLDAIAGRAPDWPSLDQIAATGLKMLLDAGIGDAARAEQFLRNASLQPCIDALIVGLESVAGPEALRDLLQRIGPRRAMFSLDLKEGQPLTSSQAWRQLSVLKIADCAMTAGFRRLLILDLACVGSGRGPGLVDACRAVRATHPDVEIVSGGGVRDVGDVNLLLSAGCDAVLVASALHDGTIRPSDVANLRS